MDPIRKALRTAWPFLDDMLTELRLRPTPEQRQVIARMPWLNGMANIDGRLSSQRVAAVWLLWAVLSRPGTQGVVLCPAGSSPSTFLTIVTDILSRITALAGYYTISPTGIQFSDDPAWRIYDGTFEYGVVRTSVPIFAVLLGCDDIEACGAEEAVRRATPSLATIVRVWNAEQLPASV